MNHPDQFTDVFSIFVHRSAYTPGQLASLSSVPKTTIVNWLQGRVQRPRKWQGIVELAAAMRLTATEANQLLASARHPTIQALQAKPASPKMQALLAFWETAVSSPPPFQAIPLPPYFVGRKAEQVALINALRGEQHTAVTCLHGMAGVGKTSLAAQMAYQLRSHFADGVLWARLDSSDTMSILATFANAYQQDVSHYHDVASRSRVVRDLLMHKQTLMILDNAQTSAQIEPLLPPTGRCAVLITTRRQDLAILAGAKRIECQPFTPNPTTSLALFAQILGQERVQAESAILTQIAAELGHLPLALVIAASRLAYEPGWQVAQFGARLQSVHRRLQELRYESHNVRQSFQLSYDLLDAPTQQLFVATGALGRQDFSTAAVAALTTQDIEDVADGMRRLFSLSLVQGGENGRFHLHSLLHDFAQSVPTSPKLAERLVSYWETFVANHAHDYAEIAREMGHIEVALAAARKADLIRPYWQMLTKLTPFFIARGVYAQTARSLTEALTLLIAKEEEDELGVGWINLRLGQLSRQQQDFDTAEKHLHTGLQVARKLENRDQIARCLTELGIIQNCRSQYANGKAYLLEALPLAREKPINDTLPYLLEELGILALLEDENTLSARYYQEGLNIALASEHQTQAVMLLKGLGALHYLDQDHAKAKQLFEQGYVLAKKIGFHKGLMMMNNNLGVLALFKGQMAQAEHFLLAALDESTYLNDFQGMGMILKNLARLARGNGRFSTSRTYFNRALTLAQEQGWQEMVDDLQVELDGMGNGRDLQFSPKSEHLKVFI
ncbi:MAG: hypothetical protein GY943_32315 [Chloroflexi bacterium]|nr:hypothetical protein [Chloroflexota bacterium]